MAKKKTTKDKKNNDNVEEATPSSKGEKKKNKDDKNKEIVERPKITDKDFKNLRGCLQKILDKINSLILPLIRNCRSDKVIILLIRIVE